MKNIFPCLVIGIALLMPAVLLSDSQSALSPRTPLINFQGYLEDASGLACDGTIDLEARFYKSEARQPSDLVYAEKFLGVTVQHGMFRVPLFGGIPQDGTTLSMEIVSQTPLLYVDIKADGMTLLEGWPLGSQLASIRAERAVKAEALRQPISLTQDEVPKHKATLITSGILKGELMPPIPAGNIKSGVFDPAMISKFEADKVTTGTFAPDAYESGILAEWFDTGTLPTSVIPDEVMLRSEFGVHTGVAMNGQAVQLPSGFQRSECMWFVSLSETINPNPGTEDGIDHIQVLTDYNGVVKCMWDTNTGGGMPAFDCTADYITICKK